MEITKALGAAVIGLLVVSSAFADQPPEAKGRYTMTPVEGGLVRLDTETGAVALCTRKADAWSCEPFGDKATPSDEKSRLEAENKELKARIKSLEESMPQGKPSANGDNPAEPPGGISKLPTEKEVDEALDYVERMYKKFRDRIQRLDQPPNSSTPKSGDGGSGAL